LAEYDPNLRAAVARCMGPGDGEDALQEARLRAIAAADGIGPHAAAYLAVIARRAVADVRRDEARRARIDLTGDEADFGTVDPFGEADAADDEARLVAAVRFALGELPDRHRAMLVARALEGASDADLAARFGVTPGSVSVILSRARQRARHLATTFLREGLAAAAGWRARGQRLAAGLRGRVGGWSVALPAVGDQAVPAMVAAVAAVAISLAPPARPPATTIAATHTTVTDSAAPTGPADTPATTAAPTPTTTRPTATGTEPAPPPPAPVAFRVAAADTGANGEPTATADTTTQPERRHPTTHNLWINCGATVTSVPLPVSLCAPASGE
jgi:RNA polymerase sigma factor (sigma-70 family)